LDVNNSSEAVKNTFIDVLNKASSADFVSLQETFPALAADVSNTVESLEKYNYFLSINIANAPSYTFTQAWNGGSNIVWLGLLAAVSIPVLSAVTQWVNFKLMPQPAAQPENDQAGQMMQTMKMMNKIMPIMSAYFCFILPAGMGLYWVAGAVVRSIQQVIINRHMDKIDIDEMIKINVQKRREKLQRRGIDPDKVNTFATMNTKNAGAGNAGSAPRRSIAEKAGQNQRRSTEIEAGSSTASTAANVNAKPGSLFAKANMVREYNERNNKK
jgi:YidC/Oxa1 family membrane protein insertase